MKAIDFAIGILIEDYKSGLRTKPETTAEILAVFSVVGHSEQLKNAEQEGYKKGWEEGAQYGYSAAHEGR